MATCLRLAVGRNMRALTSDTTDGWIITVMQQDRWKEAYVYDPPGEHSTVAAALPATATATARFWKLRLLLPIRPAADAGGVG
ncbi:hypothetical protein PG993_011599 [Apiospora rasikravindrae]|uniref:Uncharacterized protein n=1 Tax=Apiospora rasikravindrae TaxID=990691 RepID=A0ABR1S090_9PEZI